MADELQGTAMEASGGVMGGRTDAHERRLEVMARALNFGVPLGLYDEIQKPAEIVWGEVLTENARLEARLVAVEESEHFCDTVEDGWRPCPASLCEARVLYERLVAVEDALREMAEIAPTSNSFTADHAQRQAIHRRAIELLGEANPGRTVDSSYWLERRAALASADTGRGTTENLGSAEGALHELWVVQSETHLQDGALAYWGPYAVEEEAHKMLNTCAHGALIYIPKPLVPANHT